MVDIKPDDLLGLNSVSIDLYNYFVFNLAVRIVEKKSSICFNVLYALIKALNLVTTFRRIF